MKETERGRIYLCAVYVGDRKEIKKEAQQISIQKDDIYGYIVEPENGRAYDSVSIGAKINITDGENAGQYYEVCVVKVDRTNRMYLHEVDIEKADSVPFNYAQAEPAKKHSGYNYLPISSIFDRLRNVKNENVKYQLGDNELEETDNKELVARNDLTEEKLVESLDMNSPISLKTKPGKGGEDMRDISIVFKKDAVASGEIQKGNFKDGVAAVILPTDASDNLKARLNQEGVNTILYDPNLPDARKKAISELKDVRFQIEDSDMDIDYDEVVRENGELRKINEELKNQLVLTKDYTPRKEDIRKYAKSLLREYNSTYSQEKLESNLSRFYEYIQKAERMDAQELANVATQIGRAILEKSQQTDQEQVKVYKNILQDIKGTPIYVPEEVRRNLDSEGGYNNFRKRYFGKLNFRNNGVSVDVAYNELAGMHPELFPLDIVNPTDQLLQIADVLDDYQPKVENPFKADMNELSVFLGQEILDNKANIRNIPPTLADKIFAKANRTEQEYIAKRKEYEQKLREYRGNVREREQGRQDKKQIIRDVTKMQKWLLSPTDRDHVPESMRTAVAKFLSCVDYSSSRLNADGNETQRTREWNEAKYLSALGANIADNLNVVNLIPIAKDVVSMFGGNSAARMDMQGLQYLVYACNEMKKFVEGDSKNTTTGIMYKWISPLARMTGIPIANLLRDTGSVVDTALDIAGANAGDYWKTKRIYDISSADNVTMYAKKALKAYREGKKELGDRILSDLIEAGQSDKTVNSGVKRGLKNDPVIQEAAEAMMNWDLETYEEKVEEVADRGIDKELIVKAVDMVINKKNKDAGEEEESTEKDASEPEEKEEKKETPLYEASDANDALNAGEYDKANKILDKVVESKVADGKTKKEAISSVKSSFSSKYKKRYIAAGADERAKIEIELERLRVGGSRIFSSEDFARWRKNAKKK